MALRMGAGLPVLRQNDHMIANDITRKDVAKWESVMLTSLRHIRGYGQRRRYPG